MGPKAKKRRRTDRREKEKPLLAVQGLLRLEHCFIKSNNDDAEVMEVQVGEEKKKITLAPDNDMGKSEHDMVGYKAGYDTGPVNPLPQDEREEEIYQKRKKIDDANEYFEQRKKDQAAIDTQVLAAIKKEKEGQALRQYLKAPFALSKGQFPHTMSF